MKIHKEVAGVNAPAPLGARRNACTLVPVRADIAGQVAVLDPQHESAHALALASQIDQAAASRNTERAREAALAYWRAWYAARYRENLAISPTGLPVPVITQFLVDHALVASRGPGGTGPGCESAPPADRAAPKLGMGAALARQLVKAGVKKDLRPPKLSTIELRLSMMSAEHRRLQAQGGAYAALYNPCLDPAVKLLLANLRRSYAHSEAPAALKRLGKLKKAPALTVDMLQQLLASCDDSPAGIRDRAILTFAFSSGGRRRSEVAHAGLEQLRPIASREGGALGAAATGYIYDLLHSKTNQTGEPDEDSGKPVMGAAAQALTAWLELLRQAGKDMGAGPIFRRIRRGGRSVGDEPLTPEAIFQMIKMRCRQAGLDAAISPHSLRAGFLTEVGRNPNVPFREGMQMSGHRDLRTAMGYVRAGELTKSAASRLLDPLPNSLAKD